jgi:hypothetical protein
MDAAIYWMLSLVIAVPSAIVSIPLDRWRRARQPGTARYTWGIYLGLSSVIFGTLALGSFVLVSLDDISLDSVAGHPFPRDYLLVGGAAWVVSGYFALLRYRFGLAACALFSLNLLWWLVLPFYAWNRWGELRGLLDLVKDVAYSPRHIRRALMPFERFPAAGLSNGPTMANANDVLRS